MQLDIFNRACHPVITCFWFLPPCPSPCGKDMSRIWYSSVPYPGFLYAPVQPLPRPPFLSRFPLSYAKVDSKQKKGYGTFSETSVFMVSGLVPLGAPSGAAVLRRLEQRRRLHKSRTASCSSSDASDEDSESRYPVPCYVLIVGGGNSTSHAPPPALAVMPATKIQKAGTVLCYVLKVVGG
jgi:hypothetical protein